MIPEPSYQEFLSRKLHQGAQQGFTPLALPMWMFDFQTALTEWAIRQGRGAIFADCGLGKTPMQLVWAENVVRHTNRPVLVITPLAVSHQTVQEAEKFQIEANRSKGGAPRGIVTVTNYESLHYFSPDHFSGVVCDESSILKNFDGQRRGLITEFMRRVPYRLLCTATAAPNDYVELGTSSEALGHLGHMDMLGRFFKKMETSVYRAHGYNGDKYALRPHAEHPFWRWVCSWARAMRKPSDLGFDDGRFTLPPLNVRETTVRANRPREGMLFDLPAIGLHEEREAQRRTIRERCEAAAAKVADTGHPAVVWCHRNDEGDTLAGLIPDAVQVSGADPDGAKEEKFLAFQSSQARVLITKPKIGAFGLNWQHCAHVVYFPSHSYEQYYQAVRRCWRFGQERPVTVDLICTEADERVITNLQRKAQAADQMFSDLVAHMNDALGVGRDRAYPEEVRIPTWV